MAVANNVFFSERPRLGARVLALFSEDDETQYPGEVVEVNGDGSYNIAFDDGDFRKNVPLGELFPEKKEDSVARMLEGVLSGEKTPTVSVVGRICGDGMEDILDGILGGGDSTIATPEGLQDNREKSPQSDCYSERYEDDREVDAQANVEPRRQSNDEKKQDDDERIMPKKRSSRRQQRSSEEDLHAFLPERFGKSSRSQPLPSFEKKDDARRPQSASALRAVDSAAPQRRKSRPKSPPPKKKIFPAACDDLPRGGSWDGIKRWLDEQCALQEEEARPPLAAQPRKMRSRRPQVRPCSAQAGRPRSATAFLPPKPTRDIRTLEEGFDLRLHRQDLRPPTASFRRRALF